MCNCASNSSSVRGASTSSSETGTTALWRCIPPRRCCLRRRSVACGGAAHLRRRSYAAAATPPQQGIFRLVRIVCTSYTGRIISSPHTNDRITIRITRAVHGARAALPA